MSTPEKNRPAISRAVFAISVLVLSAILFVALNTFSNVSLQNARLDLTERSLFTLSDGTRNIVANLREPVTLRFYYSEDVVTEIPRIENGFIHPLETSPICRRVFQALLD